MFENLKEVIKQFKGIKSCIFLKCDNCESVDLTLYKDGIKYEVVETDKGNLNKVEYFVQCNKCKALSMVTEYWELNK